MLSESQINNDSGGESDFDEKYVSTRKTYPWCTTFDSEGITKLSVFTTLSDCENKLPIIFRTLYHRNDTHEQDMVETRSVIFLWNEFKQNRKAVVYFYYIYSCSTFVTTLGFFVFHFCLTNSQEDTNTVMRFPRIILCTVWDM